MTDPAETGENVDKGHFKKGYDPRRWLKGAPKKPKSKRQAEELIEHVIWEILSEEIINPATGQVVDRLRAMIRSMSTNKQTQDRLLDRIAGKVTQAVDVTTGGEKIELIVKYADDNPPSKTS